MSAPPAASSSSARGGKRKDDGDDDSSGDQEMTAMAPTSYVLSPSSPNLSLAAAKSEGGDSATAGGGPLTTIDLQAVADGKILAPRTWGDVLFPPLGVHVSFWQQGPVDIVSWWLTLTSLAVAMAKDPADLDGSNERDRILRIIEIVLACCFMIEWVLRTAALGLGEGSAKAFRWLDLLFSAACAVLHILFFAGAGAYNIELLVAKSVRLFRPLVRVTTMPSVRVFITSMVRACMRGTSVIVLFLFFLAWFGAGGNWAFGGALHSRCVSRAWFDFSPDVVTMDNSSAPNITKFIKTHNLNAADFVCGSAFFQFMAEYYGNETGYRELMAVNYSDTFTTTIGCSQVQTCIYHDENEVPVYGGFKCPFAFRCLRLDDNPYHGVIGFDNFLQACLTIFVGNTFQIWYELEGWLADTGDPGAHHFFLLLILIGGLMIPNVTTVILSIEFDASMAEERRNIVEQMSGITASRAALQNVVRTLAAGNPKRKNRGNREIRARSGTRIGGPDGAGDKKRGNSPEGANDDPLAAAAASLLSATGKRAKKKSPRAVKKGEQPSLLDWTNHKDWDEAAAANPVEPLRGGAGLLSLEEEMRNAGASDADSAQHAALLAELKSPKKPALTFQQFMKQRVVKTKLFTLVTGIIVACNCVIMSLENYFVTPEEDRRFYVFNAFFTAFYIIEYLLRFSADGFRALKKVSLNLDLVIVVLSIVDLATSDLKLPGVRAFRVVRLVKLLKFFPSLYEWIIVVAVAIQSSPVLLVVMLVIQVSFACICMPLLGGRFCGFDLDTDIHLSSSWTPEDLALFQAYQLQNRTLGLDANGECMGRPRVTFDTLGDAIIAAYQIATADDWDLIMFDAMRARGSWIALLFMAYFYVITYLILSQIIAILLTANKQQEDVSLVASGGSGGPPSEEVLRKLEEKEREQREREKKEREAELKALEEAQATGITVTSDIFGDEKGGGDGDDDEDDDDDDDDADEDDAAAIDGSAASSTVRKLRRKRKEREKKKKGKGKAKVDNRTLLTRFVDCFFRLSDRSKEWARIIASNHRFQWFMSIVIIVGSLSMAFEVPTLAPDSTTTLILVDFDVAITSLYVFELVISLHAYGLVRRPTSYLQRDPWNVMDALLVIVSVIGLFSSSVRGNIVIRVFRIMRAVRPLRVVKRSPGMRLVLSSLIGSAAQMANVFVLAFIFFFTLAVVGMQFFSGYLHRCYIGSELRAELPLANCTALNGTYRMRNGEPSFDTIGSSFAALFLVATLENWAELMYRVMDSPGPMQPPRRGANLFAAPFFLTSSFLLGFFIAGFFVSVLIDSYNREKRAASLNKSLLVLREQEAWLMSAKRIARVLPHDDRHIKYDDDSCMAIIHRQLFEVRMAARKFVDSPLFQHGVSLLVLANFVMMALITYPALPYTPYLELFDDVFIFIWIAEAAIKVYALKWRGYSMSTWNRVDFIIMIVSTMSFILSPFINPKTLSLVRVVRVFRLIRVVRRYTKVTTLLRMMGRAFVSLGHVLAFTFLVFFIFAVAGMNLFGRVGIQDRFSNFRSLGPSLFLLLRVTLGGNWIDLFMMCASGEPFCDSSIGECGLPAPVPQLYFFVFLFIATFVLRNLFTAVMLDAFTSGGNLRQISSDDARNFYTAWKKFDEDDAFMIHPFDTLPLLREIPAGSPAILGFAGEPRRTRVGREFRFLVALQMLSVHDPVPIEKFVDTLFSFSYLVPMPDAAALSVVREGSAHLINPKTIEYWKTMGRELCGELYDILSGLFKVGKAACSRMAGVAKEVCADLAGIEYDAEAEKKKKAEEEAEKERAALAESQRRDKDQDADAKTKLLNRRSSVMRAAAGVLMDGETAADLSEEDLFGRTASYVMINTLIMRKRQLMREQIRLNERIALRKFDQMGLRGLRNLKDGVASPTTSGLAASPSSGNFQLRDPPASPNRHGTTLAPSPSARFPSAPESSAATPSSAAAAAMAAAGSGGGVVVVSGYAPSSPYTSHHDEWHGQRPEVITTREMLAQRGDRDPGLRVAASPAARAAAKAALAHQPQSPFIPANPEATFFNSVCSYFANDERGVFINNLDDGTSTASPIRRSNSGRDAASRFFDDDDDDAASAPAGRRALSQEDAPSVIADVLRLVDDLYRLGTQVLAADAAQHTVELARSFVELEWWSEAMCDAVRALPGEHSGVDVARALLPTNAGMKALVGLHDTISEGVAHMSEHYERIARADARLEHDWFAAWLKSDGAPHAEWATRFPELMQQRSESLWVGLLAKTLPTLELIARVVPGLRPEIEVDPSVILVAAETAIRRGAVWVSIVPKADGVQDSVMTLTAHCDPDYVAIFGDAVRQAVAHATSASPKWKDFVARVAARAPTATQIAAMVAGPARRHLAGMRAVFDEYVAGHKALTNETLQSLERLSAMRVVDLQENRGMLMRQSHQAEQLRLCLQLLEQTYQDRDAHGAPESGLHFGDNATARHPKKSTVVATLVKGMNATVAPSRARAAGAGGGRSRRSASEEQRSAAYDVAHAAELAHDCARKALHALMECIPGPGEHGSSSGSNNGRDGDDSSNESFSGVVHHHLNHPHLHGQQQQRSRRGSNAMMLQPQLRTSGGLFHADDEVSCKAFAQQSLTAVSRLASAVAAEPAPASEAANYGSGRAAEDGETPDATTTRLQSVVAAATGPEFRAKLKLLCDSGVTVYVLRAMPHVAEAAMMGVANRKDVGINAASGGGLSSLAVSPPKRLWLRLSKSMDQFELRQPVTGGIGGAEDSAPVVARIPLGAVTRIDGDTIGAAQAFGKLAASAWPFLETVLQTARVMRFVVDTRRFNQRKRSSSRTGGASPDGRGDGDGSMPSSPALSATPAAPATAPAASPPATAPLSLMMPYGTGHDSVAHGHERSIVLALPGTVVYGEWLGLLRDVARHRKLLPVLYASQAEELRLEMLEEDRLFKFKSAVTTIRAVSKISNIGGFDPFAPSAGGSGAFVKDGSAGGFAGSSSSGGGGAVAGAPAAMSSASLSALRRVGTPPRPAQGTGSGLVSPTAFKPSAQPMSFDDI